jgi:apolipoprotein D and lipocalin family protein
MIIFLLLNVAVIPVAQNQAAAASAPSPSPVEKVDISRYAGKWHEIAKIPNFFQRRCATGTTATYTPQSDGTISIVNQCTDADGETITAHGTARSTDPQSNAILEVSFVRFLGFNLFWGEYWIIGLDEKYTMAVVGHPKHKYAWILARNPDLPADTLAEAFSILKANGYDPDRLELNADIKRP